jgi:cell division protein ZapE
MVTPTTYYHRLVESDQILLDGQQLAVVEQLQFIFDQLIQSNKKKLLLKFTGQTPTLTTGLYLFGDVGIGKTFLLDCFYYCLPFKNKLRIHFHNFMKMVQEQLKELQGEVNPLAKIAKKLARQTKVICFDELIVNDIADAMILAGLFKALYREKVCLLFTSNQAPDNLYLKGLQRDSFLPAIELIKQNSIVMHIASNKDYRMQKPQENCCYFFPLNPQAQEKLQLQFELNSNHQAEATKSIKVLERDIRVQKIAEGVVWFDFLDICGIPRSQQDYLVLAQQFHTFIVSNVTVIQPEQNDLARSFINLVDVLYDATRKLIISAQKPADQLYQSGRMLFDFSRTRSRLAEMQTFAWQKKCEALKNTNIE